MDRSCTITFSVGEVSRELIDRLFDTFYRDALDVWENEGGYVRQT